MSPSQRDLALRAGVEAASRGNREAYAKVVTATRSLVCSLAFATVHDVPRSEDAREQMREFFLAGIGGALARTTPGEDFTAAVVAALPVGAPSATAAAGVGLGKSAGGASGHAILYRVQTAKKPQTRAERIMRFVAMCARHDVTHPRRQPKTSTRAARTPKNRAP